MEKYTDIEIDEKYTIPAGTQFYAHSLNEKVTAEKDIVLKVTNMTAFTPDLVHGVIQDVIENPFLKYFLGSASTIYSDRPDAKISVNFKSLKKI
jgi:hypothetical protein